VWDFAVEIRCLRAAGLTHTHLRWLLCKGYVEHALEETQRGDARRLFCATANLALTKRSCFVLTQAGIDLASPEIGPARLASPTEREETPARSLPAIRAEVPQWDAEQHTLNWRGRAVKHFRREAPFQEAILAAFQANGWAPCVTVSLPRDQGVSPKERLHETIKNLNRGLRPHLRFTQEGNGSRVGWVAVN
jgi:hypothetical protein